MCRRLGYSLVCRLMYQMWAVCTRIACTVCMSIPLLFQNQVTMFFVCRCPLLSHLLHINEWIIPSELRLGLLSTPDHAVILFRYRTSSTSAVAHLQKDNVSYPSVDPNILSGSPSSFDGLHHQLHFTLGQTQTRKEHANERRRHLQEKRPSSQLHPLYSP